MPKVERVAKLAPPPMAVTPGSLLADAVPVSTLCEQHVRMCVYGRNRSGKTTLAAQFPKPSLFISTEPDACGGATSITNMKDVHIQRVSHRLLGQDARGMWVDAMDPSCVRRDTLKGSAKFLALAAELSGTHPFKTVVLDTLTSLQDMILVEMMGWDRMPDVQHVGVVHRDTWPLRAEKWRGLIRPLLEVSSCNMVFLCQEKDHNPPVGEKGFPDFKAKLLSNMQQGSFMAPALGASNAQWLQDACGYVIQVYEDEVREEVMVPQSDAQGNALPPSVQRIGTGRRARHLRLLYHPNFAAGGRWQWDRGTPEFVTADTPADLYGALARLVPALSMV